jgi:hypothetical protein
MLALAMRALGACPCGAMRIEASVDNSRVREPELALLGGSRVTNFEIFALESRAFVPSATRLERMKQSRARCDWATMPDNLCANIPNEGAD